MDVVWLQDETFPTFSFNIYFADGGLGDANNKSGTTQMMFNLLASGTSQQSQSQIANQLDQLALSFGAQAGYESSVVSMKGLLREIKPSIDLFCHILHGATFSQQEINVNISRAVSRLENISASPAEVAERTTNIYNFAGTPFENPLSGRLHTIKKLTQTDLAERWNFFKTKVKKKIFISGPKQLLDYEKYFAEKCSFITPGEVDRTTSIPASALIPTSGKVIFVKIPNANQVQIRYAAPLSASIFKDRYDLVTLSSGILGSGFTSLLMQEVRVKKGYTYGVSAQASPRKLGGQSAISTFTKNETFLETVDTVEETLKNAQSTFSDNDHLESAKRFLVGRQLFQFDDSEKLLSTFIAYDHLSRDFSEITDFGKNIKKYSAEDFKATVNMFYPLGYQKYNWVFVGDESLVKKVKARWKDQVIILNVKDIL